MKCGAELPTPVEAGAGAGQQPSSGGTAFAYGAPPAPSSNPLMFGGAGAQGMVWRQDQLTSVGTRFIAFLIDGIIVGIASGILTAIHLSLVGALVGLAYFVYFWSTTGQTIGDQALKIKVVRTDGQPLSITNGALRYVLFIIGSIGQTVPVLGGIGGLLVLIGLLWAFWDPYKQGWHDKLANTVVISA
jgi:uncharacterized RDD family membrane protein YckC